MLPFVLGQELRSCGILQILLGLEPVPLDVE